MLKYINQTKFLFNITKYMYKLPNYSYSKFYFNNPNSTREERQKAIKIFLDNTRP